MHALLYFTLFGLGLYALIGLNFALVLCFFAARFLTDGKSPPTWLGRIGRFPLVWLAWPRYARRMMQSTPQEKYEGLPDQTNRPSQVSKQSATSDALPRA